MERSVIALAGLSLAIWLYLLLGRGGFWRAGVRLDGSPSDRTAWPEVAAVVPARDEADVIGRALASLLVQDYPGAFHVILVDDHSSDGTEEVVRCAARGAGRSERLTVLQARPLPPGWAGKLWALSEGVARAEAVAPASRFLWFTDADIEHGAATLRRLVAKAEDEDLDLVSLMIALSCCRFWERLLIPPFVFFFQKLYPFAWVNDPGRRTAAAAGGCMLLRGSALRRAGGLAPIRGELIDDCALAALVKAEGREGGGRIWLGLTASARSLRSYPGLAGIWRMVARSAYAQLGRSPSLLVVALVGMFLTYLAPPISVLAYPLHGQAAAGAVGFAAWALMTVAVWPTLRLYRQPIALAPLLPLVALIYCAMTLHSALGHARGRGGLWKGRVEARSAPQSGLEDGG